MDKDNIFNTNPMISTLISYLVGILLVGDLTASEQNALGNWIYLIGQTIITHAASQSLIENRIINSSNININSKNFRKTYNPIIYDIETIKKLLKNYNYCDSKTTIENLQKKVDKLVKDLEKIKKEL